MEEQDRILLFYGWVTILIAIIVLMSMIAYRLDKVNRRLDRILSATRFNYITAAPTPTDATMTDATPTEPSDDEIVISVRPELSDASEETLEASEQPLEVVDEEIDLDEANELPEASRTFLGSYELTAYEWTGNPCANGNYPSCGYTVACNSLALGTRIYIEGYGEYVVEDRGGMADNVIDIYMGDYDTCIQFGRQTANVYLVE